MAAKIEIAEEKLFDYHQQFNMIYGCLLAGQTEEQVKQRFPDFMDMLGKVNKAMEKYEIKK